MNDNTCTQTANGNALNRIIEGVNSERREREFEILGDERTMEDCVHARWTKLRRLHYRDRSIDKHYCDVSGGGGAIFLLFRAPDKTAPPVYSPVTVERRFISE